MKNDTVNQVICTFLLNYILMSKYICHISHSAATENLSKFIKKSSQDVL